MAREAPGGGQTEETISAPMGVGRIEKKHFGLF